MVFEYRGFRIAPYSGNTCWKIQEKSEEGSKYEWREPYYFPSTFKSAFLTLRELVIKKNKGEEVLELKDAIKEVIEIDKELFQKLEELPIEKPSDLEAPKKKK